jgi:hypothetical protein
LAADGGGGHGVMREKKVEIPDGRGTATCALRGYRDRPHDERVRVLSLRVGVYGKRRVRGPTFPSAGDLNG